MSAFGLSDGLILTARGRAFANDGDNDFPWDGGTLLWIDGKKVSGFHSSDSSNAFARSVIDSAISHQKLGFAAPPNVSQR